MNINCECNNEESQIRWVRGNTQPLAIPLEQEVVTENEEIRTEPYYPSESDKVTVYLVGRFKRKAFTPEIDGNVLIIREDGTLSTGSYHVEVLIEHQDGTRNRSLWCNQVVITESNDTVLEEWDEFKQQEPQARAAIFFFAKGDKGDPFTYEDFTQEQIEDLKKPAVDAAAELTDEVHALEAEFTESENERVANENQRKANEIARENAESSREEQSALDHTTALADHTTSVGDHTTAQSDHTTALSDHTQASSDHVTANGDHTIAESDHALAATDHTTATSDHQTAEADHAQVTERIERADADHVQAAADNAAAESDHTTATSDHAQAATDHNAATSDHDTATSDHATASTDHATAQSDHATATNDHDTATTDHQTAVSDHSIADGDHTLASADHTTAQADHAQAATDHTRAENDNATATSDHSRAVGDHITAAEDHTQAVSDHTTAAADHTTAESDHAAVEVYVDSLGVFDLSKHNAVGGVLATYADLSAALTALNALDSKYKYGGMSFKFVRSSDNKYIRYNLIADEFTTDVTKWAIDDVGVYVENPEFVYVKTDNEGKILWAIKTDGSIYYGAGVPQQVIDYINEKIAELSLDEYEDIVAFLDDLEKGNKTLQTLLNEKVDKEEGKSLIDEEVSESLFAIEDPEGRSEITTDSEDKIISYRKKNGTKVECAGLETPFLKADDILFSEKSKNDIGDIAENRARVLISSDIIKKYNLPDFGTVNIIDETFYLTADIRYSDLSGVYLIRDYPDTDENAHNLVTLDYFYIKSTLRKIDENTYEKYNDGIEGHDVKLTFYPAGLVTKVGSQYYVTKTLDSSGQPIEGESIEVTQIVDVPHVNAWPVNKKNEHYCTVAIDFGHYLSGTFRIGIKFQGSSTLLQRKKNFRFTFYKSSAKPYYPYDDDKFGKKEKIKIGEFVRLSGFNLKANATDPTRVKEALMYRVIEGVWNTAGASDSYPWVKEHTAYTGATGIIKGFPIECNIDGAFYGYDFFSLKKDGKNYLLDKDEDGMFECGTRGNINDKTNWTDAHPIDWEDELNDEEDWVIENQTQSNYDALTTFFAFINSRLYKAGNGDTYLSTQVTNIGSKFYVTSTLAPDERSVTATRTNDPAYIGSDDNLYILSELTDINGTLYVTSTLVDGQPTADSVTAVLSSGGHNIYLGSDGERYLSTDLTTIDGIKYVTSKIVWNTESATEVTLISFDKETMPERMSIEHWLKYIVCMQVFLMRDNTCRNMVLYTGSDKKKFYPFFYDLDLSWPSASGYNQDIMIPAGEPGSTSYAADMSLWENFKNEWWDEIINCYHTLRDSILNISYMRAVLKDLTENVPEEVLVKESAKWGIIVSSFDEYIDIMAMRLKWLDEVYYK